MRTKSIPYNTYSPWQELRAEVGEDHAHARLDVLEGEVLGEGPAAAQKPRGAAVAAAGGGEKWNPSTLGAQFEEDVSSSRNTTRERASSVTGKSGIVEMFPEGKP